MQKWKNKFYYRNLDEAVKIPLQEENIVEPLPQFDESVTITVNLSGDCPELYGAMRSGFVGDYNSVSMIDQMPVWFLAAYEKRTPVEKKYAEMEGVEKSILIAMADDVQVSVKNYWVEVVVKKQFED